VFFGLKALTVKCAYNIVAPLAKDQYPPELKH
jgi:hypothetical protein